ncbi:MAG: DUF362 domain-containing protein [Acidobacteria bacterium]|nr:DUF362 domain-containing protein [Acidobacteriota bacterium]
MIDCCTRRQWMAAAAGAGFSRPVFAQSPPAPAAPVAIARCRSYGAELAPALDRLFDRLGGLGRLVKGKTVAIKLNLTGSPTYRLHHAPLEDAQWTHHALIGATCHLMGRAGAHRIRLLESAWSTADPVEEYMLQGGWNPRDFLSAAPRVEFENTNYLGRAREYSHFPVPRGGHMFRSYDLNHSYEDCDVFVSLAKLKEHNTTGVTLSMKNCFGITPCTIYGEGAGVDEPSLLPRGGRGMFHSGHRQPSRSVPSENDPKSPREGGYRVPRVVADLVAARPIHLAVIDGIRTMTGGEGPWINRPLHRVDPGVLIAGTNPVSTDAVATAVMGYDPMADRGTPPFETSDSTLRLAEDLGAGTRDLKRIEVLGTPIREARFEFYPYRKKA